MPERSAADRFGYVLRKWRKARGLSQDRLGAVVHVSGDLLHKIEIGVRRASESLAEHCERVLEANGELLSAWHDMDQEAQRRRDTDTSAVGTYTSAVDTDNGAHRVTPGLQPARIVLPVVSVAAEGISVAVNAETGEHWPSGDAYATDREIVPCRTEDGRIIWVSIPRRDLLMGGLGIAASAIAVSPAAPDSQAAKLLSGIRSADGSPFERFEKMRTVLMECDNLFGPPQVMRLARQQLVTLESLRRNVRGTDYRRFLDVEIQFADLLAWLYQDSGDHSGAQYWLSRALDWAHIAGDAGTVAFILARKSQLAGQFNDGAEAVEVGEAATRYVAPASRPAVIATTYAAHGYALRGDKDASKREYDRAHELLSGAEGGGAEWYGKFLNLAYVEVQRAHSLTVSGEYGQAASAFQTALATLPESYYRDRGVYLARKALAHAGAANANEGDPEEQASAAGQSGLKALAIGMETRSARIHSELHQVDKKIARWDKLPSVGEFRNAMSEVRPKPGTYSDNPEGDNRE